MKTYAPIIMILTTQLFHKFIFLYKMNIPHVGPSWVCGFYCYFDSVGNEEV
jgi:hypothetical protein